MPENTMMNLYISPFILMTLLWIFARHDSDRDYKTLFFVSIGLGFGNSLLLYALLPKIGPWSLLPSFFFSVWLLIRFCYVPFSRASLIIVAFWVVQFAMEMV